MLTVKIGDTVQLNSGGPLMTVRDLDDDGRVMCQWFGEGKMESWSFHKDMLKLAAPLKVVGEK